MPHVSVQALLASSGDDRSTGLEAHLVSANSRYIQEQQEQQQVGGYIITFLVTVCSW